MPREYTLTISRLTVDKLGVKLYDKVSAVIGELVANAYDADATEVKVKAPMSQYLATKPGGEIVDKEYEIVVKDNGIGMNPGVIDAFYLKVGAERRDDPKRGNTTKKFGRKVMGRKGIGKLAPFGICSQIEVISAGGDKVQKKDPRTSVVTSGYETAHLVLEREEILKEHDIDYHPVTGDRDGSISESRGTKIVLKKFYKRKVPTLEQFERQLSQRFGIRSDNWNVILIDSTKTESDPKFKRAVGKFSLSTMENTKIEFLCSDRKGSLHDPNIFSVIGPDGQTVGNLSAGFTDEDEKYFGITGWVAYSKKPYKDDLMAGVRIYCRKKIAAQTSIFGRKAGFTGEHDVRSYLVGELHADWLDDEEDLIQTDRRDILWSHEIGQKFEEWGQNIVRTLGRLSRNPMRKKIWDEFQEIGDVEKRITALFPHETHKDIRDNAWDIIEQFGKKVRREELDDPESIETLVDLGLLFAPHITLDRKLKQAADQNASPLSLVTGILKTARIAELASYGRMAEDRVKVIEKLYDLKDDKETKEADLQDLIHKAPWLINSQWSPITSNQAFSTLKRAFEKYYKEQAGKTITLNDFSDPLKRPDFVLSTEGKTLQVVEIKEPNHKLKNEEMDRIVNYVEIMDSFLSDEANSEFKKFFDDFHVTLVCEGINLKGTQLAAFGGYKNQGILTHVNWNVFLLRTETAHQDFLKEARRQKEYESS